MHPFVALARQAIETYLATGQIISPPEPLPEIMAAPGAVFVSLHMADDKLRGCRGTVTPTEPTLAEAIIKTAIASATADPRFKPMVLDETAGLKIKVDQLGPLEVVSDINQLDIKVYGVLIQATDPQHLDDRRRALLLPDIAAVDSVASQLALVRHKAGLLPDTPTDLFRFIVERYQ